ncbi:MAG: hypothetical protein CM1200mP28_18440 [Deltaproteobacteria bacterium]|nr:MAG: hypothetical protein CM1200mP28_18440 [Deltaproteobacteria bacterium]
MPACFAELTYGLERIASYLQDVDNVFDLEYTKGISYSAIFRQPEFEHSKYTFEVRYRPVFQHFNDYERKQNELLNKDWFFRI